MAFLINNKTVINNDRQLSTDLISVYDVVTSTANDKLLVNREYCHVTAAGQTITLPISPTAFPLVGWEVVISVGNFSNTIVARNGANIMGLAENMTIDRPYAVLTFLYVDATEGWRII